MNTLVFHVARPVTLWALHFITVYALISGGCGPRALMTPDMLRVTISLVTLGAGIIALWFVIAAQRRRRGDLNDMEIALANAAWWSAVISLVAILFNAMPVALLTSCTG